MISIPGVAVAWNPVVLTPATAFPPQPARVASLAGVGKGRQVAGLIYEHRRCGGKRVLWVSVSNDLKWDAERDLADMKLSPEIPVHPKVGDRTRMSQWPRPRVDRRHLKAMPRRVPAEHAPCVSDTLSAYMLTK